MATASASPQVSETFAPEELAAFERDGYAIVRGLAPESIRQRILEVTLEGQHRQIPPVEFEAELQYPGAPASLEVAGGRTVRRLKQAHSRDYAFTEWLTHPGLVSRLAQILGPEIYCPLAHHNCVMTKEPEFSSDTGWHQDIRYWSFSQRELVSVWLALGHETQDNGCLQLIPGSHRMTFSRDRFDDALFFRSELEENQSVLEKRVFAELSPGDVLFFHCRTLHAATRNFTNQTKYAAVFTFRGKDDIPLPDTRSTRSPEILIHAGILD